MSDEWFRIIVAGGVILAAVAFLVVGVVAVILANVGLKLKAALDPILAKVNPIVQTVRETATDLQPKVSAISKQAVEVSKLVTVEAHRYAEISKGFAEKAVDISDLVKTEAHRYADISKDVAGRTSERIAKTDSAIGDAVDQVQNATGAVRSAVIRPFREIDGVLTGVGTAFATFARGRKSSVSLATQDEEMFI